MNWRKKSQIIQQKLYSFWNSICLYSYYCPNFNILSYGKKRTFVCEVELQAYSEAMSYHWILSYIFMISYNWKNPAYIPLSYSMYQFGIDSPFLCSQQQLLVIHYSIFATILHQQVALRNACLWFLTPQLLHSLECLFFSIVCYNYRPVCVILYGPLYDKYYSSVWRKLLASPTY